MNKRVNISILKNKIIVFPYCSDFMSGIWTADKPFVKLPKEFNIQLIQTIKEALKHSFELKKFDDNYSASKLLKEATKLTFKNLQESSVKYVSLSADDNYLYFTPYRNLGSHKGFVPFNELQVSINLSASDDLLLNTLIDSINRCE